MNRLIGVAAVAVFASLSLSAPAWADPDPHVPNGDAGWCPGGYYKDRIGGARYCTGVRYDDGSFYSQPFAGSVMPFQPGHWQNAVMCSALAEGQVEGFIPYGGAPSCGGGPQWIHL